MKKLIALAVAGAFATPIMAADVTVKGDVEFQFIDNGTATYGSTGDADYTIQGSEEIEGLLVTASVDEDEDARLSVSGGFGTVEIGNDGTDTVLQAIDEAADFAEAGAGLASSPVVDGDDVSVMYSTAVNGVNFMVGYAAGSKAENETAFSYGATFAAGPVQFGLAGESANVSGGTDAEDALVYNVGATIGAVSVGYEATSNRDNTADRDGQAFGGSYNYGMGKVFYESNEVETNGTTDSEVNAYGVSYGIGNLNTYISIEDDKAADDNITYIGTEYKF